MPKKNLHIQRNSFTLIEFDFLSLAKYKFYKFFAFEKEKLEKESICQEIENILAILDTLNVE